MSSEMSRGKATDSLNMTVFHFIESCGYGQGMILKDLYKQQQQVILNKCSMAKCFIDISPALHSDKYSPVVFSLLHQVY